MNLNSPADRDNNNQPHEVIGNASYSTLLFHFYYVAIRCDNELLRLAKKNNDAL